MAAVEDRHDEHRVTPLELFFDLVFVFAITQVTSLLAHEPTWGGVLRGMLVLAATWWAWTGYAWLTSTLDVDEGGTRLVMLASMGAMLGVASAVPGAFGETPEGDVRIAVWMVALAIDYLGPAVLNLRGWRIAPRALRRAARADRSDRAGRVGDRDRRRRRLCADDGSARGGRTRGRRHLGVVVALLRRRGDLREHAARASGRRCTCATRAGLLQLPPSPDGRRHRALRVRPRDDAPRRRQRARRGALRRRSAAVQRCTSSVSSHSCSAPPGECSGAVRSESSC